MPVMFEAIKPNNIKAEVFIDELETAAKSVADGMLRDYQAGVAGWKHRVKFNTGVEVERQGVRIWVDTDDKIYAYVHEGTGPHVIKAKNAPSLVFQSGYNAKTKPGQIKSTTGGPYGDTVFTKSVNHPGNAGRFFTKPIKEKWRPFFRRQIERALKKAAERSGHKL